MGNLMATLENSVKSESTEEQGEALEEVLDQGDEPGEDLGEDLGEDAAPGEDAEDDGVPALDDEAEFKLGDEKLTGKQLREERLMRADYTRKTQALAAEREKLEETKEENEEYKEWIGGLGDVETMAFELERHFPQAYEALRDRIIQEALEEQDLDEKQLDWRRKARKAEIDLKAREKDEEAAKRRADRKEKAQKTLELTKTFDSWLEAVMQESGLDPKNERHQRLIRNEIRGSYQGVKWSKDIFLKAAAEVAKDLGKTPPKAKEEDKAKGKPPAVREVGAKAPAKAKTADKAKPKAKTKNSEDFFKNLRNGVGLP